MTTTDLPAGSKLDARIAEEILGRKVRYVAAEDFVLEASDSLRGFRCNFGGAVFTADRDWLVDAWLDVEANREVAPYSTDMTAAWEVHRNIRTCSFFVRQRYGHAVQNAVNERYGNEIPRGWPIVFGLIEPVDICRAALEAVERETCPVSP